MCLFMALRKDKIKNVDTSLFYETTLMGGLKDGQEEKSGTELA